MASRMRCKSLSVVLKRWGFTPQRPLKRAYEQRSRRSQAWLEIEYPKVRERAQQEKRRDLVGGGGG